MKKDGVDIISNVLDYDELLELLATKTDGMSGASLAGVARAAASRALERAVFDMADHMNDCLVTQDDFENAIKDVLESARGGDGGEEIKEEVKTKEADDKEGNDDDKEAEEKDDKEEST